MRFTPTTRHELQDAINHAFKMNKDHETFGPMNTWDVSRITDMSYLFLDIVKRFTASASNKLNKDISKWDVSNVTNMEGMFKHSAFNGDISGWDVSNVKNMHGMFSESKFNRDISKWKVSNVKNMSRMFYNSKFTEDISDWDVSNVADMSHMFTGSEFNSDISRWKVSNVKNMSYMFLGARFNGDISKWKVSNVKNMAYMFTNSQFTKDISRWVVSNVTDMSSMFMNSKFNGDISDWDVSNVTNMSSMFTNSQFTKDVSRWVVSNVTDMSAMFSRTQFNGDISRWDVSNVTNMQDMFARSQFKGDISRWVVSNVTDMSYMFYYSQFNGDISSWDVSNVTNMSDMFNNARQMTHRLDAWIPRLNPQVDMSLMFNGSALDRIYPNYSLIRRTIQPVRQTENAATHVHRFVGRVNLPELLKILKSVPIQYEVNMPRLYNVLQTMVNLSASEGEKQALLNNLASIQSLIFAVIDTFQTNPTMVPDKPTVVMILNYVKQQPLQFQLNYVRSFIRGVLEAYNAVVNDNSSEQARLVSCLQGTRERLLTALGEGGLGMDNPEYNKIASIMDNANLPEKIKHFLSKCYMDNVDAMKALSSVEERKQLVGECVMQKLKDADAVNEIAPFLPEVVESLNQTELGGMFELYNFEGGRRKGVRKTKRRNRRHTTRRKSKQSKRQYTRK